MKNKKYKIWKISRFKFFFRVLRPSTFPPSFFLINIIIFLTVPSSLFFLPRQFTSSSLSSIVLFPFLHLLLLFPVFQDNSAQFPFHFPSLIILSPLIFLLLLTPVFQDNSAHLPSHILLSVVFSAFLLLFFTSYFPLPKQLSSSSLSVFSPQ